MSLTKQRLEEIATTVNILGIQGAADRFGLTTDTINRYMRGVRAKKSAKVLVFDIETQANVGYFWQPYKTSIFLEMLIRPWYVISWSAKWLNDSKMMNDVLTPFEAKRQKDKRVCKSLWKLFDEADIIIAHYGNKFDIPKMNTRFLKHKLGVPSPYQSIDTKHAASKRFAFTYNKLDALGEELGIGQKSDTGGFSLWRDCDHGVPEALKKMSKYNDQDVLLLEEIYLALRPWIASHPNMNNFTDKDVCNACGNENLVSKGTYRTLVNNYKTYICECGAFTKQVKDNLSGLAR